MLAVVVEAGQVRLVDGVEPPGGEQGGARLRPRVSGICDTDLQLARGYMKFSGIPGHEFVADVVESDTPGLVGKRVVADINVGCGACQDCRKRDGHHCARRTVVGIVGRGGALAEELVVPDRCLVPVPDSVSDEDAVFAEPLAAALHVLDDLSAGNVAVLGDGKLGLLIALALTGAGQQVTLIGHHERKLNIARAAGAGAMLERDLDGKRYANVVEATGSGSGLARALALTRPRGRLILKTTIGGTHDLDLSSIVIDEIKVVGSRCGDLSRSIQALAAQRIDPSPLVEDRYPLAEAEKAFEHAQRPGTLKILIDGIGSA